MAFVFMGTVGVLAVPVGVPGVSLLLLVMNTRELRKTDAQGNQNSAAFRRYEFLVADYKCADLAAPRGFEPCASYQNETECVLSRAAA